MRKLLLLGCLLSLSTSVFASCDDVKSQIDAKLQAKSVNSYTLDIVSVAVSAAAPTAASGAAAKVAEGKVVGTCEGDTKQIVYKRN